MTVDPRQLLRGAADARRPCEVLLRSGTWLRGQVCRVEPGGVVLVVPEHNLVGGEDLRVWLTVDGVRVTFMASVLRVGVNVPDRSRHGLLLGFIDAFEEAAAPESQGDPHANPSGRVLAVLPHDGPPVSLLRPPVNLVELSLGGLAFMVPPTFTFVFIRDGRLDVHLASPGIDQVTAHAKVVSCTPGHRHLLYGLSFQTADAPERLPAIVDALVKTASPAPATEDTETD